MGCTIVTETIGLLVAKSGYDIYTIPSATVLDSAGTEFELTVVVGNPDETEDNTVTPVDPSIRDDFLAIFWKILPIVLLIAGIAFALIFVIVLICRLSAMQGMISSRSEATRLKTS